MDFRQKFERFVLSRQRYLQLLKPGKPEKISERDLEKHCAVTPPLESFMNVPADFRAEQFLKSIVVGSVIIGAVRAMQTTGLSVVIIGGDEGIIRDMTGTNIVCFCPINNLPRYTTHENPLQSFKLKDKVRGVVVANDGNGPLVISMTQQSHPGIVKSELKLGLITDEELPLHIQHLNDLRNRTYEEFLNETFQFNNPGGTAYLSKFLGINSHENITLLKSVSHMLILPGESGKALTKAQLLNYSTKHVAKGVKYFKEKRISEAMQCYNFALNVDDTNADAYVARGAIHASSGNYQKAIEDLTKAMELDKLHPNAKNYFIQTCTAFSKSLIKENNYPEARSYANQVLNYDPGNEEVLDLLRFIDKGDYSRKVSDRYSEVSATHSRRLENNDDEYRSTSSKRKRHRRDDEDEIRSKDTDYSASRKIKPEDLESIVITKRAANDNNYSRSVILKKKDEISDYKWSRAAADVQQSDDKSLYKSSMSGYHSRSRSPSRGNQKYSEYESRKKDNMPQSSKIREASRSGSRSKPPKNEAYPWSHVDSCSSSSPESIGTSKKKRLYIPSPARRDIPETKDSMVSIDKNASQADKEVFLKVQEKLRAIEARHKNEPPRRSYKDAPYDVRKHIGVASRKDFDTGRREFLPFQYKNKPFNKHNFNSKFKGDHRDFTQPYRQKFKQMNFHKGKAPWAIKPESRKASIEEEKPKNIPRSFRVKENSVSDDEPEPEPATDPTPVALPLHDKLDEPLVIISKQPVLTPAKDIPTAASPLTEEREKSRSPSPMKKDKNETLEHLELFVQQLKAKRLMQSST